MRNLKKFLALLMAMVMTFSLMLTANAKTTGAQYTDVDNVTEEFVEAVDVLTGMKVFQGDQGAFRPASNITRGEVAAIIYRLATGDVGTDKKDLYTTTHPFTDVSANDWFAPYVGYCWNAEIIKGKTETTFAPYDNVTGYEVLAMILRAMGYDQNGEFTGPNWIINVSSIATQRDLLKDVKSTHYGSTLHLASRRDVVASILFQAAQKTRVKYTPAFGYQTGDHTSANTPTDLYNDYSSLGWINFGLAYTKQGVVIGNQQTGEKNTRLGFGKTIDGYVDKARNNRSESINLSDLTVADGIENTGAALVPVRVSVEITPYTYDGTYKHKGNAIMSGGSGYGNNLDDNADRYIITNTNDFFNVQTGIDLYGHNIRIWFDARDSKKDIVTGRPVYAYYDNATKTEVVETKGKADGTFTANSTTDLDNSATDPEFNLHDAADDAGFKFKTNGTGNEVAVFSNSFSKFGGFAPTGASDPLHIGNGLANTAADTIQSPVRLYKLISNADLTKVADQLDVVIALNIETSQITESNVVNRVPTIGVPVSNIGTVSTQDQLETNFITDANPAALKSGENVKEVPAGGTVTGVIAKDALVGNSTSALGDYEFGVHIVGTQPRTVSSEEVAAIGGTGTETAYFLMAKVTPDVSGKVVAYNVNEGTVTLENGTVLHRSKYYKTVANTVNANYGIYRDVLNAGEKVASIGNWALPQSTDQNGDESYNPTNYEFFMDFEGNYLGARRIHDFGFIYGTYLDYEQKLSSSTFTYYLTGVGMDGKPTTKEVSAFWSGAAKDEITQNATADFSVAQAQATRKQYNVTGTDNLGVPYRDTWNSSNMNYIGVGKYTGFTLNGTTVDPYLKAGTINQTDYFVNMERLGVWRAVAEDGTTSNGLYDQIVIDSTIKTLGAVETEVTTADADAQHPTTTQNRHSNLYLTEDTTFIVVEGYGTDTVGNTKVYHGLSELLGNNTKVTLKLDTGSASTSSDSNRIKTGVEYATMTYFTKSPYVYAQSGDTAYKVDTIFLPKLAVETDTSVSSLYFMGDPNYSMISSHEGKAVYQYTLYKDGVAEKVWLDNSPAGSTNNQPTNDPVTDGVYADTFLVLGKKTGKEPTTGGDVYHAVFLDNTTATIDDSFGSGASLNHTDATNYGTFSGDVRKGWPAMGGKNGLWSNTTKTYTVTGSLTYQAETRNAQAATFTWDANVNGGGSRFLRVAEAKVVNLNTSNSPSGEIWPGVTDLPTLNAAGSINPVTGRAMKVAAQLDPNNPLVVTCIYVCWDQDLARP